MKKSFIFNISLVLVFVLSTQVVLAQRDSTQLKKEVEVVKAYQPSISDAYKINDIPQIKQEEGQKPTFDYRINSQPVFSTFNIEPVQAAEMTAEPKAEMGKGLLKLGVGNYQTPYGEFFYNAQSGKKSTFGMHFKHLSSNGKVKLLNDDKVKAPRSENTVELFSKHYFRKATLATRLYFDRQAFRYYGYAGDSISNTDKETTIPYWNEKQSFSKGGLNLQLTGDDNPRADFTYKADFNYQYFGTKTGQRQHLALLNGLFEKEFDQFRGQLDAGLTYLHTDSIMNYQTDNYGKKQQIILKLKPSVLFQADLASLRLGINSYSVIDDDSDGDYMFAPNVKAEWSPVEDALTLFAGADGHLQHNYYSAIAYENQYANPLHDIKNAKYSYILTGGLRGKFSPRFNFRFQADYSNIKDQHFYILQNSTIVAGSVAYAGTIRSNTFDVLYDDLKELTIGGELYYAASNEISFLLKGKYHSYDLKTLEEAWQKPGFEATTSINFNPEGPLKITADIYMIGERKALAQTTIHNIDPLANSVPTIANTVYTMDPVIDLNFGLEYEYSRNLSFWGHVNNFSFQKYENWHGYTNQGMNLLVGLSYSF